MLGCDALPHTPIPYFLDEKRNQKSQEQTPFSGIRFVAQAKPSIATKPEIRTVCSLAPRLSNNNNRIKKYNTSKNACLISETGVLENYRE